MLNEIGEHLAPTDCTLIADRGLSGVPLVQLCRERGWHYLLRICAEHMARTLDPRGLTELAGLWSTDQHTGSAVVWQSVVEGHPAAGLEPGRPHLVFAFPPDACGLEVRFALLEPSHQGLKKVSGREGE